MIEVQIADDHPVVREGVKNVLEKGDMDIRITSQASNSRELMEQLNNKLPDIVILDIALPGKSGIDVLKEIKQQYEDLPVLMLSIHPEERFAIRALKAGAHGYLNKGSITKKLVKAIDHIVNEGKKYISDQVAEQLATEVKKGTKNILPHEKLSDRELQVMCKIAAGQKVEEIADELSLSSRTIYTYRSRLMEKMDLGSNVALTRYALSHDLIDEP